MNKNEVAELKRRLKKDNASFTRLAGCYVNADKEKVLTFSSSFLTLEDEEQYKYVDIAKKVLSGKLADNLLLLPFPAEEEQPGGKQELLLNLRGSGLEDEELLNAWYDLVIDQYDYVGNFLILLFADTYDVVARSADGIALEDGDEVYAYILGAICPVALSKPGLGYREDEHRIGTRIRDWVVGAPDTGFLFPAFEDRSADIHQTLVYNRQDTKPPRTFWENALGVTMQLTSAEKREAFSAMLISALGPDEEETPDAVLDVQGGLYERVRYEQETHPEEEETATPMDEAAVEELLADSGISEPKTQKILRGYRSFFEQDVPTAEELLDQRTVKNHALRIEKKDLQKRVVSLEKELEEAGLRPEEGRSVPVVVRVPEERKAQVLRTIVDGRRCILIPLEPDDEPVINGEPLE